MKLIDFTKDKKMQELLKKMGTNPNNKYEFKPKKKDEK